jgi:hypothetical protein
MYTWGIQLLFCEQDNATAILALLITQSSLVLKVIPCHDKKLDCGLQLSLVPQKTCLQSRNVS